MKRFADARVAAIFAAYPSATRRKLLALRQLIFDVAASTDGVGALEETVKWGQPSYLTAATKSGSTIRIDGVKNSEGRCALYFNCQTSLVETFKELYRGKLRLEGRRAIVLEAEGRLPIEELRHCIALALTYHLDKRRSKPRR